MMLARSGADQLGYEHWEGYFRLDLMQKLEMDIRALFMMQAGKIRAYRGIQSFEDVLAAMETTGKEALYQVQAFLPQSQSIRAFFDRGFIRMCADRMNVPLETVLFEGPSLWVSKPNSKRLLAGWHSEAHYYPKRRNFLNLWMPIFVDRTEENGAMHIKPGSHVEQWDFAEFTNGPNSLRQYEIPEEHIEKYVSHVCEAKRGDLIMFAPNLVHRSSENRSAEYAFALVSRVWSPVSDLTLSGNMAATPYGGDIAMAGMVVDR